MTIEEAIKNLKKPVKTPTGVLILYGINLLPESEAVGLIFYIQGIKTIYFSIDCHVIGES